MILTRIFYKKFQGGEIIQNEGARNIHKRPFSNHNNDGDKRQVMMVFAWKKSIEEYVPMLFEIKPNIDKMAQQTKFI